VSYWPERHAQLPIIKLKYTAVTKQKAHIVFNVRAFSLLQQEANGIGVHFEQ